MTTHRGPLVAPGALLGMGLGGFIDGIVFHQVLQWHNMRTFVGALLLGWGLFNLVEGLVDHQILRIHYVHPGTNELAWDLGFLAFGALLAAAGYGLVRTGRTDSAPRRASSSAPFAGRA